MKKYVIGSVLAMLISLQGLSAPTIFFTAITNSAPFNELLLASGAELEAVRNTARFPCPGCYGFEVDVVYPDDSTETWYFKSELDPAGAIWITLEP